MTYTRHGHYIPGTAKGDSSDKPDVFCGGPGLCLQCSTESNAGVRANPEAEEDIVYEMVRTLHFAGFSTPEATKIINAFNRQGILFRKIEKVDENAVNVPVVAYFDGNRVVIGEAVVSDDGYAKAIIHKPYDEPFKGSLSTEFSFKIPQDEIKLGFGSHLRREVEMFNPEDPEPEPFRVKFDPGKFGLPSPETRLKLQLDSTNQLPFFPQRAMKFNESLGMFEFEDNSFLENDKHISGLYPWAMGEGPFKDSEIPPADPYYGMTQEEMGTLSSHEYMERRNKYLKEYKEQQMKDKEVRDSLPEFPMHPVPDAKKDQVVPPTHIATEEDEIEIGPEDTIF